jgi:hypothetical protein
MGQGYAAYFFGGVKCTLVIQMDFTSLLRNLAKADKKLRNWVFLQPLSIGIKAKSNSYERQKYLEE